MSITSQYSGCDLSSDVCTAYGIVVSCVYSKYYCIPRPTVQLDAKKIIDDMLYTCMGMFGRTGYRIPSAATIFYK